MALRETARALDISPSRLAMAMGLTPATVLAWINGTMRMGHPVLVWGFLSDLRRRADAGDESVPVGEKVLERREYEKRMTESLPLTIDEHERFDEVGADPEGQKHTIPSRSAPGAMGTYLPSEDSGLGAHLNRPEPDFKAKTPIESPHRTQVSKLAREKVNRGEEPQRPSRLPQVYSPRVVKVPPR